MVKPYPECLTCPLNETGKLVPSRGAVTTDLAIVGEAPGRVEVAMGKPFVGPSGELLHDVLQQLGLDKVFITNAALCYGGNAKEIILAAKRCHSRLVRELRTVGATTIVALGNTACGSLLGNWTGISKARGRFVEANGWRVLPTYHPAAVLRNPNLWPDFAIDMEKLVKSPPMTQPDVTSVVTQDYRYVLNQAAAADFAVIDLETTGLDFLSDRILCIVIGLPEETYIFPAEIVNDLNFRSALQQCKAKWVGHNIQFDRKFLLYRLGVDLKITFDTMLGHYLLDERRGVHGLKEICGTLFDAPDWEAALNLGKSHDYAGVPKDVLYKYAAQDGVYTRRLANWERDELKPYPKLIKLSRELLTPLSNVLAEVEMRGIQIDRAALAQATEQLQRERAVQEQLCITVAGHTFNPRSPQQVGRVLFDELGLPDLLDRSTAKEVLAQLKNEHPFIPALLEYRQIEKLLGTYALPITNMLDHDDRLHTQYHITGTVTGRLCVGRDTCIEAPRDLDKYPLGVPIWQLNEGDWVYSFTWDKRLCLRHVKWVGITGRKRVLRITVRDEFTDEVTSISVTPEHQVRLYRGGWLPAGMLRVGMRLLCMPHRGRDVYSYFFPSSKNRKHGGCGTSGKIKEHRWIYAQTIGRDQLPAKWDVHHQDENPTNNSVGNLELILHAAHMKMHRPKTSEEHVQQMLSGSIPLSIHSKTLWRLARGYGIPVENNWRAKLWRVEETLDGTNHTILSIEELPEEEVWDLEVEDTHAFIGNGITLHNSSSNPNLQNIPVKSSRAHLIKNAFVASEGQVLVNVDASQVEMRCAAVFSQDPFLLNIFSSGGDIHGETAAELFGPEYSKEQRKFVKSINFGILFGEGAKGLASNARLEIPSMTEREARMFIDRYYRKMSGLVSWINATKHDLHEQNYVESVTGRRRRFPLLFDDNRAQAEREAVNFMCQSAASDIMLYTLVRIDSPLKAMGAHILLTVHDSVLVECPPDRVNDVIDLVVKVMAFTGKELYGDSVPFTADAEVGNKWGDLEEREV